MQLRDYQVEAVNATLDYLTSGSGNPIIALPTGTGKSLVVAGLIREMLNRWPGSRTLMLTHVKELVEQNAAKMLALCPSIPVGIHSAGLRRRDTHMSTIFGGMASVRSRVAELGRRDLLIIDECHLLSPKAETTYQVIIDKLKQANPHLRVVGLSATPYRLGHGMLTDGTIFDGLSFDATGVDAFNRFIREGYLCPLIPKKTSTELDVSGVSLSHGEFSLGALQQAVDDDSTTRRILEEVCLAARDRRSWLVFASGNEHAEHVCAILQEFGVSAATIHASLKQKTRDFRIQQFKDGQLRCLVNNNILTTGFDHPPLDCIAVLRPTMSPGLWVQMLGRGTRPSPATHKANCLVLDFAGNTKRLGPINDPVIPKKKGKGTGEVPVKICDNCGTYNHISARFCVLCSEEFTFQEKLVTVASEAELIRDNTPVVEEYNVTKVVYYPYNKEGKPPQIKVVYQCEGGFHTFQEFVRLEHEGFSSKWSRDWWRRRYPGSYVPNTTQEALAHITDLKVPYAIRVHINKRHPEITGYSFHAGT